MANRFEPGTNPNSSEKVTARIAAARGAAGVSYAELARRMTSAGLRTHFSALSKLENGFKTLTVDELVAISGALRVPLLSFFEDPLVYHWPTSQGD